MVGTGVSAVRLFHFFMGHEGIRVPTDKKQPPHSSTALSAVWCGGFREIYYPGRAVAGETFDPHYRAETVVVIPPSSEGVAFKPATWCLLVRVYRTKDIGLQHAHPRVNWLPEDFTSSRRNRFKERYGKPNRCRGKSQLRSHINNVL